MKDRNGFIQIPLLIAIIAGVLVISGTGYYRGTYEIDMDYLSVLSLIVAIVSVVYARNSLKTAEKALEDSQTPLLFIHNSERRLVLQNIGTGIAKDIEWSSLKNIIIHNKKLPSLLMPFHNYVRRNKERRYGNGFVVYDIAGGQYHINDGEVAEVVLNYKNIKDRVFSSKISIQKSSVDEYITHLSNQDSKE